MPYLGFEFSGMALGAGLGSIGLGGFGRRVLMMAVHGLGGTWRDDSSRKLYILEDWGGAGTELSKGRTTEMGGSYLPMSDGSDTMSLTWSRTFMEITVPGGVNWPEWQKVHIAQWARYGSRNKLYDKDVWVRMWTKNVTGEFKISGPVRYVDPSEGTAREVFEYLLGYD